MHKNHSGCNGEKAWAMDYATFHVISKAQDDTDVTSMQYWGLQAKWHCSHVSTQLPVSITGVVGGAASTDWGQLFTTTGSQWDGGTPLLAEPANWWWVMECEAQFPELCRHPKTSALWDFFLWKPWPFSVLHSRRAYTFEGVHDHGSIYGLSCLFCLFLLSEPKFLHFQRKWKWTETWSLVDLPKMVCKIHQYCNWLSVTRDIFSLSSFCFCFHDIS